MEVLLDLQYIKYSKNLGRCNFISTSKYMKLFIEHPPFSL